MFRHWAVFDIPTDKRRLDEGQGARGTELRQGANDFGNPGYDGPQPPEGHGTHHYHFRLAALDTDHLDVAPRERAEAVWAAAEPQILAESRSEEHTSELQSLMRNSYAVFCLQKKKQ